MTTEAGFRSLRCSSGVLVREAGLDGGLDDVYLASASAAGIMSTDLSREACRLAGRL